MVIAAHPHELQGKKVPDEKLTFNKWWPNIDKTNFDVEYLVGISGPKSRPTSLVHIQFPIYNTVTMFSSYRSFTINT